MYNIPLDNIVVGGVENRDLDFQILLRNIKSVLEKFIIVMVEFGYNKNEIAYILKVSPSTVTRIYSKACGKVVQQSIDEDPTMSKIDKYIMSKKKDVEDICLDEDMQDSKENIA